MIRVTSQTTRTKMDFSIMVLEQQYLGKYKIGTRIIILYTIPKINTKWMFKPLYTENENMQIPEENTANSSLSWW